MHFRYGIVIGCRPARVPLFQRVAALSGSHFRGSLLGDSNLPIASLTARACPISPSPTSVIIVSESCASARRTGAAELALELAPTFARWGFVANGCQIPRRNDQPPFLATTGDLPEERARMPRGEHTALHG
jgi:hypothetical protein